MELARVDLNLLLALDALLTEQSVTRAAERVGLSQPAMSRALGRLRDLLGDPILVRSGAGMCPTPRAEALRPRVHALIEGIEDTLLRDAGFDPATAGRTFRIATNDYCGAVLLPELVARVADEAPGVDLIIRPLPREAPERALADGTLDVAVGTFLDAAEGLDRIRLFDDGFVCVVRWDHPTIRRSLSLARYAAANHLLVSSPGEGPGVADLALAEHGEKRRVAVRVPHFLVAPAVVADSDLILTLAERLAQRAAAAHALRILKPPLDLPRFAVDLLSHPRTREDPAVGWLRGLIQRVAEAL